MGNTLIPIGKEIDNLKELYLKGEIKPCKSLLELFEKRDFEKQPLELSMFVPVGEDGGVLEKPTNLQKMQASWMDNPIDDNFYRVRDYKKALEKVIIKGFKLNVLHEDFYTVINEDCLRISFDKKTLLSVSDNETIEHLTNLGLQLNKEI